MTQSIDVSVVIPCLNEEDNVGPITAAVGAELGAAGVGYEIILIDNGSTDATVERAKALCAADPKIRLIVNNRDYGQMRSPTHGIYQACGRAVIGMCADFQDPPALIGEFIARWRAGAKIVMGVRRSEDMPALSRLLRAVGYGFFQRFGDYRVIPGATGFGLYDREVVDCLARWREPEPFFRGMLVESGYSLETILYNRPPRAGGTTKNNLATLTSFAISALGGSSRKLLRAPLYLAALTAAAAGVTGLGAIAAVAIGSSPWPWLWLTALEFNFAWVFFFLGVLGEQVRLISERTREVPLVIEKERVNFPAA